MAEPETPSTGVSVVIGAQAETSYTIHIQGRRLWTEHPVPLGQLAALSKFAAAVIGVPVSKAVVDAKIGERLGASFAMCARTDADGWLAELDAAATRCEGCKAPATCRDSMDVPLCSACFDALPEVDCG